MLQWFLGLSLLIQIVIAYFLIINIVTFFSFGLDKSRARNDTRRTPEKKLWLLTLIGGSPAALLAMKYFRHKTKKMSFQAVIVIILCLQIGVLYAVYQFFFSVKDPIVQLF